MRTPRHATAVAAALLSTLAGCQQPAANVEPERPPETRAESLFGAGAEAFHEYCALCHGADAQGYAADHAPSLVSKTFLESASDEFIGRGIREGRPGTAMAAYAKVRGGPLDDQGVESILAFLRADGPLRVRLPASVPGGDAASGEEVYAASCKPCHGTRTERGDAVHLANPSFLSAASDAFLRHAIVHGRPGTPMPSFAGVLREEQIDNVVALVRSWSAPPPAPPRKTPPEPPLGQLVINPNGPQAELTLRDNRFASIDDVHRALDAKQRLVIIDARASSDWYVLHIPGAVSVPYYSLQRLDGMPKDGTFIIAYCACPHHASGTVVDELRKRGYPRTAVLDEGIFAWQQRGYPTTSEPIPEDGGTPKPARSPRR